MRNLPQRLGASLLIAGTLLTGTLFAREAFAQQVAPVSGETVSSTATTQGITLTFPAPGQTYTRIPAVTGEVTDQSLGIEKVFVRIYDQTTGRYYDGTDFTSLTPVELAAYGNKEWILETPGTFATDHVFIVAIRGETNTGNSIMFPDRFNFGVSANNPISQTPPAQLEPDYQLLQAIVNGAQADRDRALQAYIDAVTRSAGIPLNGATYSSATTTTGTGSVTTATVPVTATAAVTTTTTETTLRQAASSGSTMANICSYTPEQFIRENSITSLLRETCGNPQILQGTLQLTTEENYNVKYKEYYDRGLLRELPAGQLNTVGLRDSDKDGLSDKAELSIGSDPFYPDTDQDGIPDGEEVLNKGTNPLQKDGEVTQGLVITNIRDGMRTKDTRPLVVGSGQPNTPVKLYEMRDNKPETLIGEDITDEGGAFMIEPFMDLEEGDHRVAAFHVDDKGVRTAQSQTVYFIIDLSLNIPPPEVTKLSSTKMKPQVYGTTIFGSTVVGHFRSTLASSAVISDTPSGEFVVTSARALNPGPHKVVLYATLPNNVRSEKVTVPFTMAEDGSIILDTFPYWWILGGAALLLLLMTVARMMRKPDTALYSIDRSELAQLEETDRIGQLTFESKQPLTEKDLGVKYIGFYLNTWAEEHKSNINLKDFVKAKPGTILTVMDIQEMYLLPEGGGEPIDVLFGKERPKDVSGYSIRYVINMPKELINKYFPLFDGKKLVQLSEVEHYTGKLSATLRSKNDEQPAAK